ncbi:MAG: SpoIID/LytB domain-containing protein [Chloroflexota bacterium]|nr:MAG: SpoIID/LytB domain-containing protein [Chloroflexota bacterium]
MKFDRRSFLKLSSIVAVTAGAQVVLRFGSGEADATSQSSATALPANILVRFKDGHQDLMRLEEYVKGVVEAEMATRWPMEALKAQAVAARTYAVKSFTSSGFVSESGQAYKTSRHDDTSAAVDATSGQVMTYKGAIILPNFFAQCNGVTTRDSERALNWRTGQELRWNYVAYLRARPCSGHAPYTGGSGSGYKGHGVGMCQTGARDLATKGMGYQEILGRYYTSVQVVTLPVFNASNPTPPKK